MAGLRIMDTTIRDGQQSLWATRMTTAEMLPILPKMDQVGYWAIEAWGGATFDSCLRFLDEDPWERLRLIKERCPNTPLAMLVRGQNLVGYKHYSTDVVERFIERAHANGIDIFRVFDALNDIDNIRDCAAAIKKVGAHFEPAISYTRSPVHTLDNYIAYARQLAELGADSLCIKDMAGLLVPYRAAQLVSALRTEIGLPVHMHCHFIGGMASTNYLRGAEEGAEIVDCAHAPLAFGNSQPAVEMTVSSLSGSPFDTGLDLDLLFEIADYWDGVRKSGDHQRGITTLTHMRIYKHQIPGGMMSNLVGQLDLQGMHDRLPEVVAEIPRVRKEVGYPPLVTPMSQIVGTQAVMNVLTGERWKIVSKEMRDYLMGFYGKTPAPVSEGIREKVLGKIDVQKLQDEVKNAHLQTYDEAATEIGDLAKTEEDVLSYALFPNEARALLEKRAAGTLRDITKPLDGSAAPAAADTTSAASDSIFDTESNEEELEMNVDQIRTLIEALDQSSVAEVTIKEGNAEVAIRKPVAASAAPAPAAPAAPAASAPAPEAPAPTPAAAPEPAAPAAGTRPDTWKPITSPMVGTFYQAPAPDADPFVKVGDKVEAGQTVCIVEAMKLMNELTAEEPGYIREVCVKDAEPVEFDQPIFYYEPIA